MLKTFRCIPLMLLAFVLSLPLTAHAAEDKLDYGLYWFDGDNKSVGDTHYWDQVEGRYTADPEDDQFEFKSGPGHQFFCRH